MIAVSEVLRTVLHQSPSDIIKKILLSVKKNFFMAFSFSYLAERGFSIVSNLTLFHYTNSALSLMSLFNVLLTLSNTTIYVLIKGIFCIY